MSAILPTLTRRPSMVGEATPRAYHIFDRIGIGIGTRNPIYYRCLKTTPDGHVLQRIDQPDISEAFSHERIAQLENAEHWRLDRGWFDPKRVETRSRTEANRFADIPIDELPRVLYRDALCGDFLREEAAGLTNRSDAAMEAAIQRYDIKYREQALQNVSRTNVPVEIVKAPSVKTLRRWLVLFQNSGCDPAALRDNYRKSGPDAKILDPEVEARLIKHAATFKDPKRPTQKLCWSNLRDELAELNAQRVAAGENPLEIPTYNDMRNAIAELDAFDVDAARHGPEFAKKKYWIVGQGLAVMRPGERIEMDEWTINLQTLLLKSGLWWRLNRHHRAAFTKQRWVLSAAMDVATKCYLALRLTPVANSAAPAVATLRMIVGDKSAYATFAGCQSAWTQRCGLEGVWTDNGSAYKSQYREGVTRLGGSVFKPAAGLAQFRATVERSFGTTHTGFARLFSGNTGTSIADKGDFDAEAMASVTIEELAWALVRWVVDCYHNKPHSGLLGETPANAWKRLSRMYGTVPPPDRDTVRNALGVPLQRVLDQRGVRVLNLHYQSLELQDYRRKVGDCIVDVIADPDNLGFVSVKLEAKGKNQKEGWLSVPCIRPGFDNVAAEDWIELMADLRRRFRAEEIISEDIVRKAMADLQTMSESAFKRANLGNTRLDPGQIEQHEKMLTIAWKPPANDELAALDTPPADIFAGVKPAPHTTPPTDTPPSPTITPTPKKNWTLK